MNYLLQQHNLVRAQAELVALQADGPSDPADQLLLGNLLLQVKEPQRSIQAFDAVLQREPGNAQAWLGKAQASLVLGDYKEAEHAISVAVEHDPKLDEARQQLEVVREVLRLDPALRGLSLADRSQRAAEAFELAMKRISGCAAQQGITLAGQNASAASAASSATASVSSPAADKLQSLYGTGMQKHRQRVRRRCARIPTRSSRRCNTSSKWRTAASICPATDLTDRALLLLAQHESEAVK